MPRLKNREITNAVVKVLEAADAFKQVQANEDLTESIPETPVVQIYFERWDPQNTKTDRNTFGGRRETETPPIRVRKTLVHVDVYARQRSQIGEDIAAVQDLADVVDEALETQNLKPYFGLPGVEAFTYHAERVVFEYGKIKYSGIRFFLELTTM